jgi:GxxExxY protein
MGTTEYTESTESAFHEVREPLEEWLVDGELTGQIVQVAYDTHCYFGSGYLQKVYEGALVNRLRKAGYEVQAQAPLTVEDEDGTPVGHYAADLLVERRVLIEVKAVRAIVPEHHAQVLNYLKTTRLQVGMLINFGGQRLQVKRLVL